jgi:hypothetical protein
MTLRSLTPRSLAELSDDHLADVHTVARWIGCSERTVWCSGCPFVVVTPRVKRFRVGEVRAWLRTRVQGARGDAADW